MTPPGPLDPERAQRRAEVAKAWARVIGRTAYVPMTADEMDEFLLDQLHVLADAVNAELFDPSSAVGVGHALVNNDFTGPESLQCTVEILAAALLLDSDRRTDRELAKKVVGLLSNLATGYATGIRLRTLDQQEHIKQALLKSKREAERRERAATERFEEVFHASAIGMALTDMAGNFVQTNSALAHILECTEADLDDRNVRELFPPEDADDVVISYREVTEGIVPRVRERRRMVRQDGTIAWVYLVISLLRDVNGEPAYHVTMVENLSELQALQNQLGQQSVRDMLTGVANRQHFQSKLDAILEGASPRTAITLLHVGIDSFSVINNGLGHLAGDRMLQVVANQLRAIVADYNAVVGRVGGDEFAILIENTPDVPHYQVLIDQINDRLAEPTFIGDAGVAVCVSIGVAQHVGRAYGRLDLLRAANSTMRRAKAVGKRQWEAHNVHEDADQKALFALTAAMPGAWENGELDCDYQPVIDLADGHVTGLEVLLRWDHPDGVIGHYACRDMSESTGMSLTIGPWAFQRACEQAADQEIGLRLRLTQMQSSDGNLAGVLNRVIAKTGIQPDRLEIALDTRAVIADRGEAQSNLQALRDNGVIVGLHEFTGSQTEFAIVEDEEVQSVILAGSIVADRPDRRRPDSLLTKVTAGMIATLNQAGVMVSVVDVPTAQDAAWWHAIGVTRAQGEFAGVPGDLASVLPERPARR
ncbi:diguanylate cyclase (GGDEF)-like protein/PAS domain S-box-containing protein [Kibdelosporangium banguiense]|uniref:Diguanylate cyclase (GGDEF)-like protein/PAS domain S-box-containing protein n=1 Tax=Kibdelosporangium banguiense TaxID=1365924 RepID=A0ABS4TEV5_9PSEU|nr:EAL domain-containing protein [Kibdelosporangium banguiense]MBP2322942.1 diguanylate cyclase (GGDEF)-like protein/PAS domain S-box-containing protein [Kibdelosporangium banguiense]